jgi:hypothetical protein
VTTTDQRGGNGRAVELRPSIPAPGRVGQATTVEQSRAVAEVEAAVIVAQRVPRRVPAAISAMEEACRRPELAARAFFQYPRAGETVSGPSVHLARELARCWGNIQYGISELLRDDGHGQSEMQAWAWDVETNTRSSNTFIVPHARDTKKGRQELTDLRDVYENNANMGSRRLREAIFSVLPTWFTETAKAACWKTQEDGGGLPMAQRVADAIKNFGGIGISQARLEARIGSPAGEWTPHDLARLGVSYSSLRQGTVTAAEEFPEASQRVTAAEITGQQAPAAPQEQVRSDNPSRAASASASEAAAASPGPAPAQTAPSADRQPQPAGKAAALKLDNLLGQLQLGPAEDVRALLVHLCGAPWTATRAQVQLVTGILTDHLEACQGDTVEAASAVWAQYRAATAQAGAEASQDDPGGSDG